MKPSPFIPIAGLFLATCLAQAVPTNVALNQPAEADSLFSSAYPAENAFDGNTTDDASRWLSADGMPHWIEVDLGQTYSLSQMKFWTGKVGVGPYPLTDYALQFWNGTGWTDLYTEASSTDLDGEVDVSFGPTVAGNRVRLYVTGALNTQSDPAVPTGIVRLFELEIYGEPHGLGYTTLFPAAAETLFDPAADLVVTFDAPITAVDLSGIRVEDLGTSTDLTGVSAAVSGNDLTISHGGLAANGDYAVHIPAGRVLGGVDQNGPIYWDFTTAPLKPQLVSYTNELPGLTGNIDFVFDRDVSLAVPSGISIKRASDNSLVTGVSASASGDTLSIAHDAFVSEESYIVVIDANAVTGTINGAGNDELRRVVYAGSATVFSSTFTDDLDGFDLAQNHFNPSDYGYPSYIVDTAWRRSNGSSIGPDSDERYLISRTNWMEDFALSPVVSLLAAKEYTVNFRLYNERALHLGLLTTADFAAATDPYEVLAAVTDLKTYGSSGGNRGVSHTFNPPADGDYYLIFYSGDTNPNQDQEIDSVTLTVAADPVVAFVSPADSSSFLESDTVTIEVEAYGVSAPITDVSLYINGEFELSLTQSGETYSWDWIGHSPGEYTLTVVATDGFGNTASSEIATTITFDDGTLPNYLGWNFNDSLEGWTGDESLSRGSDPYRPQSSVLKLSLAKGLDPWASSPEVFLFAGETYTLKFLQYDNDAPPSPTYTWRVRVAEDPGRPASADLLDYDYQFLTDKNLEAWVAEEFSFTVPADGGYHFTFYDNSSNGSGSGLSRLGLDDVRLFGNFNSVPTAEITVPDSAITTIADSDVEFTVVATDVDGTIAQVELIDADTGSLIAPGAVLTTAPYTYTWVPDTAGTYSVAARVTDNGSAVSVSDSLLITVAPNQYSISTYLGGAATDEAFTGATYLSDDTLVMSGIIDPGLFPGGVTPSYLNGATVGDRGVVVRLSEDGQTVLSVTVVGTRALDIDTDGSDRIYVAAGDDGAVVLDSTASTVLWSNDYGAPHVHRIDAADGGTFAVLTSSTFDYLDEKINSGTNYVYDSSYVQLGSMGGVPSFTTDLAVDEASQTVIFIGWKNITDMGPPPGESGINPVDIPAMVGRSLDGTVERFRAYDWENTDGGVRHLNYVKNNMADTRGSRVIIGPDGYLYAGIEFDGGNTPLRDDPFDLTVTALDRIVGGDNYQSMSNTSTVPKTFVGRYDPLTGAFIQGQWITNRLNDGSDNTIRIKNGNLLVDDAGRIHVVGGSASGLPLTHDPLSGVANTGGAFHLVYSPDFTSREYVTRLTLSASGGLSHYAGIAQSPSGTVATTGRSNSPFLFDVNPWQASLDTAYDAHFAVGDLDPYYKFQTGVHPRLFFDAAELATIQSRLGDEPYASMLAELIAQRDYGDFYRLYTSGDPKDLFQRAQASAFIYALTGTESYAADAKADIETAWGLIGSAWTSTGTKGLDLYWYATKLATAYDLCANSTAWDAGFNYQASKRLVEIAEVIETNGGTEQPSGLDSNWAAARGSSAGIAYLATDHNFDSALQSSAHTRTVNYLNANQGAGATRGWNPEGFGYTAFALGSYLGPYAIAAKRDGIGDLTTHTGLQWMPWTGFAGATTAMNVYGLGGVKTDWSDDNAHTGGEGIYGLAFALAPDSLKPGLVHAYDRFMGTQSPHGANWGALRAGTFWSILYYPEDVVAQDPLEIWDWHQGSDDSAGLGVFTFRNAYENEDDILVQFKARLRQPGQTHDGPDGLGFRIIGLGDPFAVGGGRDPDIGELNQATVYPSDPDLNVSRNGNIGSLVGTPLVRPDGGGHVIAAMATNNVGTASHKRWLVTDFDSAETGADAVIVVADTTSNGVYWQLPTFLDNAVVTSGNTFTITGTNGATLKGTILHPGGTPSITVGTKARGSSYTVEDTAAGDYNANLAENAADPVNFPRVEDNRYLYIHGSGDGDFLVVLTLVESGPHPAVTHVSGGVADAVVQVGNKNFALQTDDVLYSTGGDTPVAYTPPDATVTFDAGANGSITSGTAVQTVAYGDPAFEPGVSPDPGYAFVGWDKAFAQVVKSMTVTALYDAVASGFASWIADPLYGLDPADQDPGDDPDFDGIVSLIEYVLVLNPAVPDGFGVVSAYRDGGDLVLSYRVRDGATGVTVTPKYAADLSGSWTEVPAGNIASTGSGPGYTEYEARMPVGPGVMFMIVEVVQN